MKTYHCENVMCFTAGTLIRTAEGLVPAEEITQRMLVWTMVDGYQPLRRIGSCEMSKTDLEACANVRPTRIKADALGQKLPD